MSRGFLASRRLREFHVFWLERRLDPARVTAGLASASIGGAARSLSRDLLPQRLLCRLREALSYGCF